MNKWEGKYLAMAFLGTLIVLAALIVGAIATEGVARSCAPTPSRGSLGRVTVLKFIYSCAWYIPALGPVLVYIGLSSDRSAFLWVGVGLFVLLLAQWVLYLRAKRGQAE
jgi:hypothetical protein